MFHDTIRNNICLYEEFPEEQLKKAIQLAGLTEFVDSLDQGLDTVISENGKNVSGGQIQRIGIARLIIRNYDVIIADEITANLDENTTEAIMNNLLSLQCMLIVITHDTRSEFMNQFDSIYEIQDGIAQRCA